MSERIREDVVEPTADGRVVERVVVERKKGGFGWGMLLGVLIIAGGIIAFAYSQGSFQTAGVQADHVAAQVEDQTSAVAQNTGNAIDKVTNQDSSQTQTQTSETTTN